MKDITFSPEHHIFLWDLHEVILKKDMRNWVCICVTFNRKWELLRKLNRKSLYIFFIFLLERFNLTKKQMISEELIDAAKTTDNEALVELVTKVCSAYTPINGTVEIMEKLSELGYKHHLGSNIGITVFNRCRGVFPSIFRLFESCAIPYISPMGKCIKKPNPLFFTSHAERHGKSLDHFIFIDDRIANVKAAQSIGMHGIVFQNPKQLYDELVHCGIIEKQ